MYHSNGYTDFYRKQNGHSFKRYPLLAAKLVISIYSECFILWCDRTKNIVFDGSGSNKAVFLSNKPTYVMSYYIR